MPPDQLPNFTGDGERGVGINDAVTILISVGITTHAARFDCGSVDKARYFINGRGGAVATYNGCDICHYWCGKRCPVQTARVGAGVVEGRGVAGRSSARDKGRDYCA